MLWTSVCSEITFFDFLYIVDDLCKRPSNIYWVCEKDLEG